MQYLNTLQEFFKFISSVEQMTLLRRFGTNVKNHPRHLKDLEEEFEVSLSEKLREDILLLLKLLVYLSDSTADAEVLNLTPMDLIRLMRSIPRLKSINTIHHIYRTLQVPDPLYRKILEKGKVILSRRKNIISFSKNLGCALEFAHNLPEETEGRNITFEKEIHPGDILCDVEILFESLGFFTTFKHIIGEKHLQTVRSEKEVIVAATKYFLTLRECEIVE